MLNELYHLSEVLGGEGISLPVWHKDFKPLPNASGKKPCYRIMIGANGSISDIVPMQGDLVSCLRKWEPSNGHSFPGFNIQPLYRIADVDRKKALKKWRKDNKSVDREVVKEWCADVEAMNWDEKFNTKMIKCLQTIPRELNVHCSAISNDFYAINNLCDRIKAWGDDCSNKFFQCLETYIAGVIEKGEAVSSLLPILFHEASLKKKREDDRGSLSIFLDVPDWKEYPVAHAKTIQCINECLLKSPDSEDTAGKRSDEDAFGHDSDGNQEKLPEVKLPFIGAVKLRAMTSESPCQYRYGTIDARSFRVGAESRKRMKGALEWLSAPQREGETWGRADIKELLFAYPTTLPKSPLKLAACLGTQAADDKEARFENYARDVITCLGGTAPLLKEIEIRIFSLRKMDKARTKVVFHRHYSAQRLADAANDWQMGCGNIPDIRLLSWGNEKGKFLPCVPIVPFPLQIAECLNLVWKMEGSAKQVKKKVRPDDSEPYQFQAVPKTAGIELLLDASAPKRLVPHLLSIVLSNGIGLFLSLGNSLHRGDIISLEGVYKHKQLMPAILGLLLWMIDIRKERYMNDSPYLVGKLLKLADELHALYCKEVRNDNLPPQLIGNALMVAALDSPVQALAQMSLRIAPYLGWARTNSTPSAGLSRYFLKELGLVEEKLRDAPLPTRLDDAARAQLLLGYISGRQSND